jgi:hypothetical protein
VGKYGVSNAEGHKSLAHTDLIGENLNVEALRRFGGEEAFEQDVHSALLARGISQVLNASAVAPEVEVP